MNKSKSTTRMQLEHEPGKSCAFPETPTKVITGSFVTCQFYIVLLSMDFEPGLFSRHFLFSKKYRLPTMVR